MKTLLLDGDPRDFLIWREGSGNTIEIYDIEIGSERGKGKGRKLVANLINHERPDGITLVWAITRADNFIAQQFYEHLRFRVVACLRHFYGVRDEDRLRTVDAIMYGFDIGTPI